MIDFEDLMSLEDAAASLGLSANTLRTQASRGRLVARRIGGSWVTTSGYVEDYRRIHLGRLGRPRHCSHVFRWSEILTAKEKGTRAVCRICGDTAGTS